MAAADLIKTSVGFISYLILDLLERCLLSNLFLIYFLNIDWHSQVMLLSSRKKLHQSYKHLSSSGILFVISSSRQSNLKGIATFSFQMVTEGLNQNVYQNLRNFPSWLWNPVVSIRLGGGPVKEVLLHCSADQHWKAQNKLKSNQTITRDWC